MKIALVNLCAADDFAQQFDYQDSMDFLREEQIEYLDFASGVTTLDQRVGKFNLALESDAELIWVIRGGYVCLETLDKINWEKVVSTQKKYLGLSDFTHFACMAVSKGATCYYGQGLSHIKRFFPKQEDRTFLVNFLKSGAIPTQSAEALYLATDDLNLSTVKMAGGHMSIFTFMQAQSPIDLTDRYLFIEYHHVPGEDLKVLGYFLNQLLFVLKNNLPKGFILGRSMLTNADGSSIEIEVINHFLTENLSGYQLPIYYIDHFRNTIKFS